MRISDWSSDVCSSDLPALDRLWRRTRTYASPDTIPSSGSLRRMARGPVAVGIPGWTTALAGTEGTRVQGESEYRRSEEHTSEHQSLMRISYDVFCLKKKNHKSSHDANALRLASS